MMKHCLHYLVLLMPLVSTKGGVLLENDFSGTEDPGWYRITNGDNDFARTWSLVSSLETVNGEQHARFDISVPSEPSRSSVRWSGGFSAFIEELVTLPPVWELSFRVFISDPEPLKVSFTINDRERQLPGGFPDLDPQQYELVCWVPVSTSGWQEVTIRSSETVLEKRATFASRHLIGTSFRISLASHDAQGEPLSISRIGEHVLLLDDIKLRIPVAPFVSLHSRPDGKLSLLYSGVLQSSEDLQEWHDVAPQFPAHTVTEPVPPKLFFRAITVE